MASFETAVEYVLPNEGGLSENPHDSGGITNFGISLRFLREVDEERLRKYGIFETVNEETIRNLTVGQAKLIYRGEFWEGNGFENINSQDICNYIFDMAINFGISQAVKLTQRSCWACAFTRRYLRDDGIMGRMTTDVINSVEDDLLPVLISTRASLYRSLVLVNPKDEIFLEGWLNRCYFPIE